MAYHDSVLSQVLKMLPRHEFERRANRHDGKRRSDALSRWSQFVALTIGHLGGRSSLRDIEATVGSQGHHRYHLGSQPISRSALGRANEYRLNEDIHRFHFSNGDHHRAQLFLSKGFVRRSGLALTMKTVAVSNSA